MKTLEQILEGVTAGGQWEIGGPHPAITLIYMAHPGSAGEDCPEPPTYEPIATFFEPNAKFTLPDPQAVRDAAYAAWAARHAPRFARALDKAIEGFEHALSHMDAGQTKWELTRNLAHAKAVLAEALKD